jgi:hypothetical protein
VRRFHRGAVLVTPLAALALAALATGCSSGPSASASDKPPSSQAQPAGYKDGQEMKKCLHSYGLTRSTYQELVHTTTAVSPAMLRRAGEKCWTPNETGLVATALRRIDHCLGVEHIPTAHTGSPLADVLLVLDTHSPKAKSALKFCLRS